LKATSRREACEQRARETCDARKNRLAVDPQRLVAAIERGCGALDFALVRGIAGANVGALASRCAALGIPDVSTLAAYEQCVTRQHACAVDDLLRFEAPRSPEWIGAWPSPGGDCPDATD
jgi:hypothetical protein